MQNYNFKLYLKKNSSPNKVKIGRNMSQNVKQIK